MFPRGTPTVEEMMRETMDRPIFGNPNGNLQGDEVAIPRHSSGGRLPESRLGATGAGALLGYGRTSQLFWWPVRKLGVTSWVGLEPWLERCDADLDYLRRTVYPEEGTWSEFGMDAGAKTGVIAAYAAIALRAGQAIIGSLLTEGGGAPPNCDPCPELLENGPGANPNDILGSDPGGMVCPEPNGWHGPDPGGPPDVAPGARFPTQPGGTGAAYNQATGQGVYVLRNPETQAIEYVGRGDAPARLARHAMPGSGNEDLVGEILFNNNLSAAQAQSLENELIQMFGGPKSVNPVTPLRNLIQGVGEANPNFLQLEFAADDDLVVEALQRAGLLGR
jgi:hypothetical protein